MAYREAMDALGDPTRRAVFEQLKSGPRAVGEIAKGLPVSRPAVSQHLRVLKEAGLVSEQPDGTRRLYRLEPAGLWELRAYFDGFWNEALADFKAEVERNGEEEEMSTQATDLAVRKTITVKASLEHAFNVFTEGIATWWPLDKHSLKQEDADDVVFEARLGGRVYESWQGGEENWGEVLVWEPPRRVVFSWHPGYAPKEATEIEVRFSEEGDRTKVELEHRGWERLGDRGKEARTGYDSGWTGVLERYAEVASK